MNTGDTQLHEAIKQSAESLAALIAASDNPSVSFVVAKRAIVQELDEIVADIGKYSGSIPSDGHKPADS